MVVLEHMDLCLFCLNDRSSTLSVNARIMKISPQFRLRDEEFYNETMLNADHYHV